LRRTAALYAAGPTVDPRYPSSMRRGIRHIVIVGLMGAGKSTVGQAVAERLGWAFRDSDTDIEEATGRTVRELGVEVGVPAMHELEARELLTALDDPNPEVIAAAASTIDVEACRRRLAEPDVLVIWLRADPATLAERFGSSTHRPSYGPDTTEFLAEQAARRYPHYMALDPAVIDVDRLGPREAIDAALAACRATDDDGIAGAGSPDAGA
jgi:shikimate kinase